jgi:hypothetical protein
MTIKEMARLGGRASVKIRFKGKTKKQISKMMSAVRNKKHF